MRRTFTTEDQEAFAAISGDRNPMHLDPVAARRTPFGGQVVHGVHTLLWGLDACLAGEAGPAELRRIKADFRTPVRVGSEVEATLTDAGEGVITLSVSGEGGLAVRAEAEWGSRTNDWPRNVPDRSPGRLRCKELSPDVVSDRSGEIDLSLRREASSSLFPHLTMVLPAVQTAELLATTRLVGMECPGLLSVYLALDLDLQKEGSDGPGLRYEVTRFDPRFSMVSMHVKGPRLDGSIRAFMRPPPTRQPSFEELRGHVTTGEFAEQRALVIGGSRGLGEVTAKLLAAGGASVRLTYYRGREDSERLVADIRAGGGEAASFPFDVLDSRHDLGDLADADWAPTHLYYFSTPSIGSSPKGRFAPRAFRVFCDHYLTGFVRLVDGLHALGSLRGVLYPSTVFVEDPPPEMREYTAAKTAGEALCGFLERTYADTAFHRPRLPRLATDQTMSLIPRKTEDTTAVIVAALRTLRGA